MNATEILAEVFWILSQVKRDYNKFANEYQQYLKVSGEREYDGAIYIFPLTEDESYKLIVETEEYKLVAFEIESKKIQEIPEEIKIIL
jgi:hypothetical protein